MSNIGKLIGGFRIYKATIYPKQKDVISHLLVQEQKPSTMVISCSDLRIAPADLFASNPGELYVLSNIGGLVPKYDEESGVHGIMAAIEYAVTYLQVENIIILGHAKCDGIKMMMSDKFSKEKGLSAPMKTWLSIASEAREAVLSQVPNKSEEEKQALCEKESIVLSLYNLMEYPYIAKRMEEKKLMIYGWQFNIETGEIMAFDTNTGFFDPVI